MSYNRDVWGGEGVEGGGGVFAMWYTLDSAYDERAHGIAREALDKVNFQTPKDEL